MTITNIHNMQNLYMNRKTRIISGEGSTAAYVTANMCFWTEGQDKKLHLQEHKVAYVSNILT